MSRQSDSFFYRSLWRLTELSKKLRMSYITFRSIRNTGSPVVSNPAGPQAGGSSGLSAGSGELGGYGAALEDALAWLLDAEERLAARASPAPDAPLPDLKDHFHTHEVRVPDAESRSSSRSGGGPHANIVSQAFLLELAGQQARVGGVLALGARLAGGGALCAGEAREVRLQRRLLAARWEQLRRRALRRQAAGHAALMRAQRAARDAFRYRPTPFAYALRCPMILT